MQHPSFRARPPLAAVLLAVSCLTASCFGPANLMTIDGSTRQLSEFTRTITVDGRPVLDGMRVATVAGDTVVTHHDAGTERRFVFRRRVGYSGTIGYDSVDLSIADVVVRIRRGRIELSCPEGTRHVRLFDDQGRDRFQGRDLVVDGMKIVLAERNR